MSTFALQLASRPDDGGPEIRVLVDGLDLVALAREAEAPFAAADGQPQLAGGYRGLWPELWRDLPEQYGDGRAAVLGCECGEPGCWPLRARITVAADTVTWGDFSQPHRPGWRYDGLGPFVFERGAYDRAIAAIVGAQANASAGDV